MDYSDETRITLIECSLPTLNTRPQFTPIRTGKFNLSYYVLADDCQYVLRIAPPANSVFLFYERRMMHQEPELHVLLRSETDLPVAEVLLFDDSHEYIDRDYMLMERLPGRPLTEMHHLRIEPILEQIGRYMAEVHRIHSIQHGYLGVHKPMEPQACWADAFRMMWNLMIEDIAQLGYYGEPERQFMHSLLEERLAIFDRPLQSSLLHMDIWHQNILVNDRGRVTGILDWDRALWGDPEIEFAVLDYCGISEPAFWRGYGQDRDNSPTARLRNLFYLLYEIQKYIVIRAGRNHDPDSAHAYQRQVMQIAQQITKY